LKNKLNYSKYIKRGFLTALFFTLLHNFMNI